MLIGAAIALIGLCIGLNAVQRRVLEKREAEAMRLAESEIATIVERSELTGWGALWTVVFVIAAIVSFAGGTAATTVFQQIAAGVSWIGTLILFGLAFTTCRRRTYTIYRSGGYEPASLTRSPAAPDQHL
jgi:hypothetical protein